MDTNIQSPAGTLSWQQKSHYASRFQSDARQPYLSLLFKQQTGQFQPHITDLPIVGGEGGIRTHVGRVCPQPISSRCRCDRFGTSPVTAISVPGVLSKRIHPALAEREEWRLAVPGRAPAGLAARRGESFPTIRSNPRGAGMPPTDFESVPL